jgi:uncharacterized repeat protein (TIGR01451 family)
VGIRLHACALLAIGALVLFAPAAEAQAFRASAQGQADSFVVSLIVNRPAGTQVGDVMIAAVAVRPSGATITAPAGWTLIRRTNQGATNSQAQATYRKVVAAGEPANYTWTLPNTHTGAAGGIMAFYGVNAAAPVDVENGQLNGSGLNVIAPSVTTTRAYDMIVTTHSISSSTTFTPPGGMTEAVDIASEAGGALGITLEMNYVIQPAAGATGAKTAVAAAGAGVRVGHTVALARATTATWTGAVNNQWTNGGNWVGLGGTPLVGGEDLIFPGGAANLSNTNGYAAATTFNSIKLTGSGYTLAGNQITLGAGNLADSSVAGANTISLAMAFAATRTVTVSDAGTTLLLSGVISGAGGLTKAGSGVLAMSAVNTYTGATAINAGTIEVRSNAALGGAGTGTTVATGATLQINGAGLAIAEPLTLNGTGVANGGALRNLANNNTVSGAITLASAARINSDAGTLTVSNTISGATMGLTVGGAGNTTISGVIGTTTGSLTKDSTGVLLLSAVNTYTGATTVSGGTLRLGIANAVSASSAVTVAAGATLDMNGFSDTIGSLAGAGTVTSGVAGAVTLNAGGNNTSTAFSGVMQNGAGTLAVTKTGTGTWTLSGASTYTGLTTISAGVIDVQSNTALGGAAGATTVAAGAALQVDGTGLAIAEPLTLNGTGIANGGALRNLANNNTVSGAITLASASRVSSDAGTLTISNTIGGATQALTVAGAGNTAISGVIGTTTGTLTKLGTGTLTLSGNNTYTGLTTVSAGTLLVNGAQGSSAVSLNGGTLGGTGTVGATTSTAAGGTLAPGAVAGTGILNSGNLNLSAGAPAFSVELNGTTAGTDYDRVNVTGTVNLTGSVLSGSVGFAATDGMTFIIITNDGGEAITGTFAGLAEGATTTISGQTFRVSYVGGTGNDVVLTRTAPNMSIVHNVAPPGTAAPGTDLTYTITFTNNGAAAAQSLVLTDSVPGNADFKVGSVTNNLGTTGLTVVVAYSNNGGGTWVYVPASGGGGAPAGYDRQVTHVRWTFTGNLSQTAPNNTGSVGLISRVR